VCWRTALSTPWSAPSRFSTTPFDFAYKSNLKNLRIYEQSLIDPRAATTRHWGFLIALFRAIAVGLVGIALGVLTLSREWKREFFRSGTLDTRRL
jgi:hypothetical protein